METTQGTILVVDDNRLNRLTLSLNLQQAGHTVVLAEDGAQALDLLGQRPFDVVLLDIMMPVLDGYAVLEAMKRQPELRDVPVIVISGVEEIDSAVRCIEMGAEDYLPKPFNPVLLRARLNASLQKKRLRDLEKAYVQQEMMLRQNEKLATLGKMSAGLTHELNNPAAAARRGADQIGETLDRLREAQLSLFRLGLREDDLEILVDGDRRACVIAVQPLDLDPIARSDRSASLEDWLDGHGVDNSWEVAPTLVDLGWNAHHLESLFSHFDAENINAILAWIEAMTTLRCLAQEIGEGAGRISVIVNALKSYSYLDQAPVQRVNVEDGLESTLVILRGKIPPGVEVRREYAESRPAIEGYGSELNQVWTNLLDNAIDAVGDQGLITIRTHADDQWVTVEIEDNGPGIPEAIVPRVFDPFFTTKPPGQGAGLGLNIAHSIVVQKHQGRIEVRSRPGETLFTVSLPRHLHSNASTMSHTRVV